MPPWYRWKRSWLHSLVKLWMKSEGLPFYPQVHTCHVHFSLLVFKRRCQCPGREKENVGICIGRFCNSGFQSCHIEGKTYYPHRHHDRGVVAWLSLLTPPCTALMVGCGSITQDLPKPERISFNFIQKPWVGEKAVSALRRYLETGRSMVGVRMTGRPGVWVDRMDSQANSEGTQGLVFIWWEGRGCREY